MSLDPKEELIPDDSEVEIITTDPQPTDEDIAEAQMRAQTDCKEFRYFGTRNGARYLTSFGVRSATLGKQVVNRSRLVLYEGTDDYAVVGYDRTVETYP